MEDFMNDNQISFQRLDVYCVAKELAVRVHAARIRDAELRDQAERASKSAFLQVSEGLPHDSLAMRRKYFTCARGSAGEVAAAIDLSLALSAIDANAARDIHALAKRLHMMLRGAMR
jgi:four helix bundle protein